jgi:putative tryptophan/tyrosine transport system substrate-binding protein
MTDRRTLLRGLVLGVVAAPLAAEAQDRGKVVRIGWLGSGKPGPALTKAFQESFQQGLRDFGHVGAYEVRYAEGKLDRLDALAAEVVHLNVRLIVATDAPAVGAAKRATTAIPILMVGVVDAVEMGFVESVARPGRNVTGMSNAMGDGIGGNWVELLRDAVPGVARVAFLWYPPVSKSIVTDVRKAATTFRIQLQALEVETDRQFEAALLRLRTGSPEGLIIDQSPFLFARAKQITEFAAKTRLPAVYAWGNYVRDGGLMSYGPDRLDQYRRIGIYAGKISATLATQPARSRCRPDSGGSAPFSDVAESSSQSPLSRHPGSPEPLPLHTR